MGQTLAPGTDWGVQQLELDVGEKKLQNGGNPFSNVYIKAEDNLFIFDQVQDQAYALLLTGKNDACLKYLQGIPAEIVESKPILLVLKATAMFFKEFSSQKIDEVLDMAENCQGAEEIEGEIIAIRALLQSYSGDPEKGIKLSEKASSKIPPENTFFQNLVNRNLGVAYTIKNELNNASIWFEKLLLSSYKLEDWTGVLASYNYLTYIRKVQGRFREASVIYSKAITFINQNQLDLLPHSIKIIAGYGHLLLQLHRTNEAKQFLNQAIQLAKQSDILYAFTAFQNLGEAFIRENDIQSALLVIQELEQHAQEMDDLYEQIHKQETEAIKARINLEMGRYDLAYAWILSNGFDTLTAEELHQKYGYRLGINLPIAARIYILMGMYDRAIYLINAIKPKFLHQGAISYLIRALSVLAIAYDHVGEDEKALQATIKAIRFAEPEGNVGDFVFAGEQLVPLLIKVNHLGIETLFCKKLLSVFHELQAKVAYKNEAQQSKGSLSKRELDVLMLIAQGMTNQEIALALYLSTSTIKSHSINIYKKLNVNDRAQAVLKAHLLGMLPSERTGIYRQV